MFDVLLFKRWRATATLYTLISCEAEQWLYTGEVPLVDQMLNNLKHFRQFFVYFYLKLSKITANINLSFLLRYLEYCYEMWVKKWFNSELWRNFTDFRPTWTVFKTPKGVIFQLEFSWKPLFPNHFFDQIYWVSTSAENKLSSAGSWLSCGMFVFRRE